ncbi:hypothetical protein JCM6882_002281 [Rhodosporidiobolus microsporus]
MSTSPDYSRGRQPSRASTDRHHFDANDSPLSPRARSVSSDVFPSGMRPPFSPRHDQGEEERESESRLTDRDHILPSQIARREREREREASASSAGSSKWGSFAASRRQASQRSSYRHSGSSDDEAEGSTAEEEEHHPLASHRQRRRSSSLDPDLHNRDVSPSLFPHPPKLGSPMVRSSRRFRPPAPPSTHERDASPDSAFGRFDFGTDPKSPYHPDNLPYQTSFLHSRSNSDVSASSAEEAVEAAKGRRESLSRTGSRAGRRESQAGEKGRGRRGSGGSWARFGSPGREKDKKRDKEKKKRREQHHGTDIETGRHSPHLHLDVGAKPHPKWYKNPLVLTPLGVVVAGVIGVIIWAAVSSASGKTE